MYKILSVLAGLTAGLVALVAVAHAGVARPGDHVTLHLTSKFNALTAHTGDGFPVTAPEGLIADPHGLPDIKPGTQGTAVFRLIEKSPTAIKYDIASFAFVLNGARVEIKTALPANAVDAGTITIQKPSVIKKLLLPPILGALIWKDKAALNAGKDIPVEITEEKRW